jgi:2'-5' RNA ligase
MSLRVDPALGSGLIVEVPEAEHAVGEPRSRLDANARLGIPAHVTVLFPFMPPALIDDAVLARLTRLFAAVPRFGHRLVRTSWFGDEVLWLAPENEAPFRLLTDAVHREFPDYPPFGGQFENVVPHLTIADRCPLDQMQSAERRVEKHLPISGVASEVSLMVQCDASGAWTRAASFALDDVDAASKLKRASSGEPTRLK